MCIGVSGVELVILCLLCVVTRPARGASTAASDMARRTYTIQLIQPQDTDDILRFLKRTFYVDEPLNKAVGLCPDVTMECPELDEYCRKAIPDGLSLQALDPQGQVVGVMISGIVPSKELDNGETLTRQAENCKNPKFQKILYILARREEGARLWEKFPEDEQLVEVMVAATDPRWRKMGIMNSLLSKTEQTVMQRGISLLRIDTSSAYSAKAAERHGFQCQYSKAYEHITRNGEPIIQPQPPHLYDRVYVKRLEIPKQNHTQS